jgi:outer membrane protein OmpA-like peptidoglycan-associated protein
MNKQTHLTVIVLSAVGLAGVIGCAHAAPSQQLVSARAAMQQAREGAAAQLEPDELLVAQRSLAMAEGQEDGSPREAHYAYVAERETRIAMADARRDQIERGLEEDQQSYQRELERVALERGEALEGTHRALQDRDRTLAQQRDALAQHEAALTAEQQARAAAEQAAADAERRASDAMARLRELASVREDATETVITLSGEVLFETDRAELRPQARDRLVPVADAIRATGQTAVIAGFTDSRGSDEYNRQLSQRRADAVRMFLIGEGVPSDHIQAEGRGELSPVAPNTSAEGRAENRRVEISLHPSQSASATTAASTTPVATR